MPIDVDAPLRALSEDEFHKLAERVIGIAFDVHNEFGRLLDEAVYNKIVANRAEVAGIGPSRREVEVIVRHREFSKSYYLDLLFGDGMLVEGKTVEQFTSTHHAQVLHYLFLTEMRHGLLLNFRPSRVEKQFISTTLGLAERRQYSLDLTEWKPINESSERLKALMIELIDDWGLFLHTSLYRDSIVHFFGGDALVLRRVPIYDGEVVVGSHEVCLLSDDTALAFTSYKDGHHAMREHLGRFLDHTRLRCLQWVNLRGHDVEFRTVMR